MKMFLALPAMLLVSANCWADVVPTDCVYARDVKQFEILNDETLLLNGKFDRQWINRLNTRCAGLQKNMILNLARYGTQICANDRITATERGAMRGEVPAATCRLGRFEPVGPEQVTEFRTSLAATESS